MKGFYRVVILERRGLRLVKVSIGRFRKLGVVCPDCSVYRIPIPEPAHPPPSLLAKLACSVLIRLPKTIVVVIMTFPIGFLKEIGDASHYAYRRFPPSGKDPNPFRDGCDPGLEASSQ